MARLLIGVVVFALFSFLLLWVMLTGAILHFLDYLTSLRDKRNSLDIFQPPCSLSTRPAHKGSTGDDSCRKKKRPSRAE